VEPLTAVLAGTLYAVGLYLLLSRNLVRLLLGLGLISHAANLLIFVSAGLTRGRPPLVADEPLSLANAADPLPQALILTAIVISFGVFAFALILIRRAMALAGSEDVESLTVTER
jgi:multicomponent Na+:H+ antiporter subunit C